MTEKEPERSATVGYWQKLGLSVRKGYKMHRVSGQLAKGPDSWRNVTEHCLVQVARTATLGKWIGLPEDLITDMKLGAVLEDFSKSQEITATREANQSGNSPLAAVRKVQAESEQILTATGFDERVRRLANACGDDAFQLIEAQRILDQSTLSDNDWAYLIVHYVDDCSIGSDWVRPSQTDATGKQINVVDVKTAENKAKPTYQRISQEIGKELTGSSFEGMNNHDAMAVVSHQIEQRLAHEILQKTDETIDPLDIPELVDQRIREDMVSAASVKSSTT